MPRSVALDLLGTVLGNGRPLDEAVNGHSGFQRLAVRDRAFARNLLTTTLRRLGQLDALIDYCLSRPLPGKARSVRDLLRLGACQLVFLDTPPHAAVDTSVRLARSLRLDHHRSLINAVLRRLSREGGKLAEVQDAARLNTPDWLWRAWSAAYGEPVCRRIAEAHLGEPSLDLTVRGDVSDWAEKMHGAELPTGGLRLIRPGQVDSLPGYATGDWWVQDAAAALPAKLLGRVKGLDVIDLCAAPGGKTAQLAAAGARVIAVDRSARRIDRLTANLKRLGLEARTVVADAGGWRPEKPADAVLLDAPCSSTGTIRRHPDVARLKTPKDVRAITKVQDRLLAAAMEMVAPGGLVVYATCSLLPEEGPERVAGLLDSGKSVARDMISADEVGGLGELLTPDGDLRSLPCHLADVGGMDGFYAARLRRR